MNKAVSAIKECGVQEKDLQIDNLSIEPHYEYSHGNENFIGYCVRNMLVATLVKTENTVNFNSALAVEERICYGTSENGRLENGRQLPKSGKNFEVYSSLGDFLGRNYVHSKVYAVILESYRMLEHSAPSKIFVYGETGWAKGGRFRPHKTHQNGLSVDFFVPVIDVKG